MKKFAILFSLLLIQVSAFCQQNIDEQIRHSVDSLILLMDQTEDEDRQVDLIMNLYKSKMESYPLLVIETGQKLAENAKKTKHRVLEASSLSFFGQGNRLTGNYIKGLEYHHKAVAMAEQLGNKALLAIALNQMGHIYKDREENDKALSIYRMALKNSAESKIQESKIWPMMNLGAVFLALNQIDSSLYYSQQAHERCMANHLYRNLPYILLNIAGGYSKKRDNAEAMKYFSNALSAADVSQSVRFKTLIFMGMAEHFQRNHQLDSSALYAKKAVNVVRNTLFAYLSMKPAKLLTDLYENSNADSTLKYLKIYRAANDSLFSTRANQQLQMMTFEEDQRQQELAAEKTKFQNKIKTNILLGVMTTILLITLILYRNNKQKHKANLRLHQQKNEIESTLSQLKSTQSQLVQSEKMASLGELTAGIAHEIQNPLNFVNNFSEVNSELIAEMKQELEQGKIQEAKTIADHINDNEQKIIFHGKRADAIVKSMLQHSRSSNNKKEPTDINALADEYLRLAYHGLRAKDKSFNVTMKTDFDPNIGLINVIPQDIGRVILNLITNAFYAVSHNSRISLTSTSSAPTLPPSPLKGEEYTPTVSVITKRLLLPSGGKGGEVGWAEVRISDNGPGIPQNVLDKIFQPFFTTKPTGQGTGLGLSLSYDIIKAHGGELKVETKEGEGTTFIILLPSTQS